MSDRISRTSSRMACMLARIIGPITSCDRWIPDVLCRNLGLLWGPGPIMLRGNPKNPWVPVYAPKPEPPDPSFEQYVDYCVFMRSRLIPFEQMSDDFDIPGYMGQWVTQDQSTLYETYSNPGYMLRFEAEGYAPFLSRTIKEEEGEVQLDVILPSTRAMMGPDRGAAY